jgi:hypothetical protein
LKEKNNEQDLTALEGEYEHHNPCHRRVSAALILAPAAAYTRHAQIRDGRR